MEEEEQMEVVGEAQRNEGEQRQQQPHPCPPSASSPSKIPQIFSKLSWSNLSKQMVKPKPKPRSNREEIVVCFHCSKPMQEEHFKKHCRNKHSNLPPRKLVASPDLPSFLKKPEGTGEHKEEEEGSKGKAKGHKPPIDVYKSRLENERRLKGKSRLPTPVARAGITKKGAVSSPPAKTWTESVEKIPRVSIPTSEKAAGDAVLPQTSSPKQVKTEEGDEGTSSGVHRGPSTIRDFAMSFIKGQRLKREADSKESNVQKRVKFVEPSLPKNKGQKSGIFNKFTMPMGIKKSAPVPPVVTPPAAKPVDSRAEAPEIKKSEEPEVTFVGSKPPLKIPVTLRKEEIEASRDQMQINKPKIPPQLAPVFANLQTADGTEAMEEALEPVQLNLANFEELCERQTPAKYTNFKVNWPVQRLLPPGLQQDFRVVTIPGDGNCMYSALSVGLFGNVDHMHQLKLAES